MAPKTTMIGVVTKIDKVGRDAVGRSCWPCPSCSDPRSDVVPVSAESGEQVEVLVDVLAVEDGRGPGVLPGRRAHRRARRNADGGAHPRGGARGGRRRTAALAGRGHRGDPRARGTHREAGRCSTSTRCSTSSGPARRRSSSARAAPASKRSAPRPASRSRSCSARKIFLELHVKVAKDWQRDPKQLGRLGF